MAYLGWFVAGGVIGFVVGIVTTMLTLRAICKYQEQKKLLAGRQDQTESQSQIRVQ